MAELWGADNITGTTFRKLLHMTAGIPDFDTANPCFPQPCEAKDALRAELYETPAKGLSPTELMNVPWVRNHYRECKKSSWAPEPFCYSSSNFMLLGMALAHRAGVASWEQYDQTLSLPTSLQKKAKFAPNSIAPKKYADMMNPG